MGERDGLAGAGSAEDVSTVAAVVFPICEGEGRAAAHTNVGVDPFRGLQRCVSSSMEVRIDGVDTQHCYQACCSKCFPWGES